MFSWKRHEADRDASLRSIFMASTLSIRRNLFGQFPAASSVEIDLFVIAAMTSFILMWGDQKGKVQTVEADRFCGAMIDALAKATGRSSSSLANLLQDRFREYRPFIAQSFSTAAGDGGEFLMLALDKNALVDIPDEGAVRGVVLEHIITHTAAGVKKAYSV